MAPTATRAAVSRALARSSTSRMSSWPYLTAPARSAWPGRGRVTAGRSAPDAPAGGSGSDDHRLLPVLPVLVRDQQRDRRAGRHAVANAAQRLRAIRFDRHAAAAAVAALAAAQLGGHRVDVDREARRHAFDDRHERLAVRFAGGQKSQHSAVILSEIIAASGRRRAFYRAISTGRVLAPRSLASLKGGFVELFANRFALMDKERTIDLATGRDVLLIITSAGGVSDERRWAVRCDVLQKLRHRSIARLLDYGAIGEHQRFEAWDCGSEWHGAQALAREATERATQFLGSCGLSVGRSAASSIRHGSSNKAALAIVPDSAAGYPIPAAVACRDTTIENCGLELIARSAVAPIAELFEPESGPLARAVALWGPRGLRHEYRACAALPERAVAGDRPDRVGASRVADRSARRGAHCVRDRSNRQ